MVFFVLNFVGQFTVLGGHGIFRTQRCLSDHTPGRPWYFSYSTLSVRSHSWAAMVFFVLNVVGQNTLLGGHGIFRTQRCRSEHTHARPWYFSYSTLSFRSISRAAMVFFVLHVVCLITYLGGHGIFRT